MSRKQLADYLKEKRKAAGVSQSQVAEKLGYKCSQFISNWERGISSPPVGTLKDLAALYNVPDEEMLQKIIDVTLEEVKLDLQKRFKMESSLTLNIDNTELVGDNGFNNPASESRKVI